MEPNESHHHQQSHSSPYYHHHQHHPTTVATAQSPNNGLFPPQPNDGSSSLTVYPHSMPSSTPIEPLKKKRGRPRKYVTPEQDLAAKKMASSSSSSSVKVKREQAALTGAKESSNFRLSKKSQLDSLAKTGQSFTPHIVNIAPGENVAQRIMMFANQNKHELCIVSASGTISSASLMQPATSGGSISCEGQYEILSLSGSFIRDDQGGKTGGLSVYLSGLDGQIIGGVIGTHLIAASPVQVILGTFQLDRKKDVAAKGDGQLTSAANSGPVHHHQTSLSGSPHHYMMQAPQGMHMTHSRPSEWGRRENSDGYDLSGRIGQQVPD